MNSLKRIALFFVLTAGSVNNLCAQQWQGWSVAIPSPNASSLGLYTELPVSYFTGIPNISVPLYTVKGNKINMPISMSYNASGLRPEVHPGWVGNGWSLQAGGLITRKPNGLIDEYNRSSEGAMGYYYTHGNISAANWATAAAVNTAVLYYGTNHSEGIDADEQPDEFDFNFLGYSGKFFLDQNGNWQVQCDKNLKVSFQAADLAYPYIYNTDLGGSGEMSKTFMRFTITDEAGNQYIFGSNDTYNTGIEFTDVMIPNGVRTSSLTATSWYLTKIISADQSETINLSYERGPLESTIGFSYSANQGQGTSPGSFGTPSMSCSGGNPGSSGFSGSLIFPVYLTKITMPTEDLEIDFKKSATTELKYATAAYTSPFGSSANPYAQVYQSAGYSINPPPSDFPSPYLADNTIMTSTIIPYFGTNALPAEDPNIGYASRCIWLKCDGFNIVNSSSGVVERSANFSYNNDPTRRLHLNAISINDRNSLAVQNYNFTYNPLALAGYLASNTDSWGFNNGNTTTFAVTNTAIRAPDPTGVQTQAEILTSLTYPTGGTANFYYEPNTYSQAINRSSGVAPAAVTGVTGGLRINHITSIDNNGNSLTKKYYYVNGYTPTAQLSSLPSSGILDSQPLYNFTISGTDLSSHSFTYQSYSSSPVFPLTASSTGTHIGYTNVAEVLSDGSYTIYNFTNDDNGYQDIAPLSNINKNGIDYFYSTSLAYERGKLLNKTSYNQAGHPVLSDAISYSNTVTSATSPAPTYTANAVASSQLTICSTNNVGAISRTAYQLYYYPFVPISEATTSFDLNLTGANNFLATTKNNTYDQYQNLIEQDITNSDGNVEKTRYLYPYNFATSSNTNPYSMMVTQNMNNVVIEKIQTVTTGGTEYVTGGEVHTYQSYGSGKLYNDAAYNFEATGTNAFSTKTPSTYSGVLTPGQLNLDGHYILRQSLFYDGFGNVSSTLDNAGRVTGYVWDYNGSKPVAKVQNANNIYSNISGSNPATTSSYTAFVPGSINGSVSNTIIVQRTGSVNVSVAYSNNSLSGNNSSTIGCILTNGHYFTEVNLCTSTPGGTSSCGSTAASASIANVPPGTYTLSFTVYTMAGFQNYYGFTANVSYPTYQYYTSSGFNDIAYNSFEYAVAGDIVAPSGNWTGITSGSIISGSAAAGHYYYNLTASASGAPLVSGVLNPAQTYIVSYWSKNGSYTVSGSQSVSQGTSIPSLASPVWTYFQHVVTGVSAVSINGNGAIDELRLYPQSAQMTSYVYEPLVGLKGSANAKSQFTYYSYDNFERLNAISDQTGSIVKAYAYNYAAVTNQPVITGISESAGLVTINFTPVSGCTGTQLTYTDMTTNVTNQGNNGCSSPVQITLPQNGHTYKFTITCYSPIYPSPAGTTSAPSTLVLN